MEWRWEGWSKEQESAGASWGAGQVCQCDGCACACASTAPAPPLAGHTVPEHALPACLVPAAGEALPVLKRPGDDLAAGSLNRDGLLVVRASRLAADSTPARIARMTVGAQAARPHLRSWLDEFGVAYSKVVIAAATALLVGLLLAGVPLLSSAGQRGAFYRAMGLLTVASPCALVMVPLAYVSAIAAVAYRQDPGAPCRIVGISWLPACLLGCVHWLPACLGSHEAACRVAAHNDGADCATGGLDFPHPPPSPSPTHPPSLCPESAQAGTEAGRLGAGCCCSLGPLCPACRGILLKGGRVLDALASCGTVAFDKTGTLTTGSLWCTSFQPLELDGQVIQPGAKEPAAARTQASSSNGTSAAAVHAAAVSAAAAGERHAALEAAVALSQRSSHPVSEAVVLLGERNGVDASSVGVSDFVLVAGGGAEATLTLLNNSSGSSRSSSSSQASSTATANSGTAAEAATASTGKHWRAAIGSLEFVASRLGPEEVSALQRLCAAQAATGVVSVLVLEEAVTGGGSISGDNGAAGAAGGNGAAGAGSSDSSSGSSSGGSSSVWVATFEDSVRKQSSAAVRSLQTVSDGTGAVLLVLSGAAAELLV